MAERINKARYWLGVLYPENMVDGWQDSVGDILQVPYAYCIHDADHNIDGEDRKTHVHFIIAFTNTTTYKHALEVFKLLGEKSLNKCEAAVNIRHAYDYLIHDTETCRKQKKYLYPAESRITWNNFDIGAYEQISQEEKNEILRAMLDFLSDNQIKDLTTFYIAYEPLREAQVFDVYKSYGGLLEKHCKANFHRFGVVSCCSATRQQHGICCPDCGSVDFKKQGKTASDLQRYQCRECGKTWSE